ncbi:TVP38/TMEM64 family protein [Nanoarchaeota archaeon]
MKRVLALILIILVVVLLARTSINDAIMQGDIEGMTEYIQGFGWLAAAIFVFMVILEVVAAPIPALLLYAAGGIVFGPLWGGTLALIGNTIGAIIAYYIARFLGKDYFEKHTRRRALKTFNTFAERFGVYTLFLLRLNPFTSSDIFSYIAGLSKMSLRSMVIGTTLGLAPLTYANAYFGHTLVQSPWMFTALVIISVAYVALFAYAIFHTSKKSL